MDIINSDLRQKNRLHIGRLVRGVTEFIDTFDLFNLEHEVGSENLKTFQTLADEYSHLLSEAEKEVEEKEAEAFYGIRPSDYEFLTEQLKINILRY